MVGGDAAGEDTMLPLCGPEGSVGIRHQCRCWVKANLVPYQRRAQHAGRCGVEVEGGRVPTRDWFLNVQILTSGRFR
jgi:hypothetical protein